MLNFLKEVNIKEVRESNLKLIFGLGSVVYAAFGILLHTSAIQYNDPLWLRLVILLTGILSLAISAYYPPAKKHLIKILFANLYMYNAHLYYLLFVNDFDANYKLSLLVVTFASILFIQDRKLNKIYLAANACTHVVVMIVTHSVSIENISVAFLILMVLAIGYFTNSERIDAFSKISDREAILNSINNNVYHGIFRINTEDEVIYANENFARMLGYNSVEEIHILRKPLKFANPDAARQINVQKMKCEEIKHVEAEIIRKDNQVMWVLLSLTPFFNGEGSLLYYDGAIIDITDKKIAEKGLMLFSAAIDHSTISVAITDNQGYIRYVNPFFSKTSGYSFDELLGTRIQEYVMKSGSESDALRKAMGSGANWKGELNHKNKNGRHLTQLTSIAPIRDKNNEVINYVVVSEDITQRKVEEQELLEAKELAESANQAQEQFLSTISHELRTPMNAVIGITNLLLEEEPRQDQIENLKILKFSANNLLALINDMLDLTKIEAGKLDFLHADFDFRNTLDVIKKSHTLRATQKNVEIALHIERDIPNVLVGDSMRLNQIFNNLVSNAVKFTDNGRIEISVKIRQKKGDMVELLCEVKDSGIGIPPDKLEHIFEKFSQASAITNRIYGGTGLGLAITKKLIELQGGSITVQSAVGKGTAFTLALPFRISAKAILPKETSDVKLYSGLTGIFILLVEDNKVNQKVATKFLTKWDAIVEVADNGAEALEKIKSNHYDVVLMDLLMPVMDGYTATKEIRKMAQYKELPIVALSASAMSHEREQAFASGMDDYICKPFVPSELYNKIAKYAYKDIAKLKSAES